MMTLKHTIHIMLCLTVLLLSVKAGPQFTTHEALADFLRTKDLIYAKISSPVIAETIITEAIKYRIDPFMISAVIAGESSFNPNAVGSVGEVGLMQLRPSTAKWVALKMKIPWKGKTSLTDPAYNIKLGVAYLSYLKKRFSPQGGLLYLAAYNMGETSLLKLLANKIRPSIYSDYVMKYYLVTN